MANAITDMPNVWISGTDMPLPAIEIPIPDGEVAADVGQSTDQQAQPGSTPPAVPKTLREYLDANPAARAELEAQYVTPARTQAQAAAEQTARARIAYDTLQQRQNELTDRLLGAKPDQIAGIQTELRTVREQITQQQQAESQRTARERQYALAALKDVFGLTDEQINQMPQLQTTEALRDWAMNQSPHVQAVIKSAAGQARTDQETIERAQGASRFGERLQQTPAPSAGTGATETPRNTRTFEQIERGFLEGKVSFADYAKARASSPQIRARI